MAWLSDRSLSNPTEPEPDALAPGPTGQRRDHPTQARSFSRFNHSMNSRVPSQWSWSLSRPEAQALRLSSAPPLHCRPPRRGLSGLASDRLLAASHSLQARVDVTDRQRDTASQESACKLTWRHTSDMPEPDAVPAAQASSATFQAAPGHPRSLLSLRLPKAL
eukprot:918123-Rhodomonas_salina.1